MGKGEYLLVAALLVLGVLSLPLVQDVYAIQSIALAICSGVGLR